jgi:MoxR-like ATPase
MVLATQNPIDLEGTYPLPEAQLDRFLVRLILGYPEEGAEVAMLRTHNVTPPEPQVVLDPQQVQRVQAIARRIHAEQEIIHYAVSLCRATRASGKVVLGASPRASLALLQAAKAHAVLAGRTYVTPDDIQGVASPVLAHRLVLVPDLEGDEEARQSVVTDALSRVPYSRAAQ